MKAIIVLLAALILANCADWNRDLKADIKKQVEDAKAVQWDNIGGPR